MTSFDKKLFKVLINSIITCLKHRLIWKSIANAKNGFFELVLGGFTRTLWNEQTIQTFVGLLHHFELYRKTLPLK